jgi:predicted O-methyltransferase YrrM
MTTGKPLDLTGVESSYKEASYGDVFYALVRIHKPRLVVELGTYLGYSGLHMAAGLRDNAPVESALYLVDLWDDYPYRHCSIANTKSHFTRNGLLGMPRCPVHFVNGDAAAALEHFSDGTVDLLHIDISNDGAKMAEVVPLWERKLSHSPNALMILEGGSSARDRVDWMMKYDKPPIRPLLEGSWVSERFSTFTFEPFPSLTLLRRRT